MKKLIAIIWQVIGILIGYVLATLVFAGWLMNDFTPEREFVVNWCAVFMFGLIVIVTSMELIEILIRSIKKDVDKLTNHIENGLRRRLMVTLWLEAEKKAEWKSQWIFNEVEVTRLINDTK